MVVHNEAEAVWMYETLRKVKAAGYDAVEIHYACNDGLIEAFCQAQQNFDLEICTLSVAYNGQFPIKQSPFRKDFLPLRLIEVFGRAVDYANRLGCKFLRFSGMPGFNWILWKSWWNIEN